jgi:hypothetical protein
MDWSMDVSSNVSEIESSSDKRAQPIIFDSIIGQEFVEELNFVLRTKE